ncbi:MAG: hypothetical protein HEQ40_15520 [Lacibacter sp.]
MQLTFAAMNVVIDLSLRKQGTDASFFFSDELLAILQELYPEHRFTFINNANRRFNFSESDKVKEILFNPSINPLRKIVQQKSLQKETELLRPDVYIGIPGSIFSAQKKFCLFISGAYELKTALKKNRKSKAVFCTDAFSFDQFQAHSLVNNSKLFYAPPPPCPFYKKIEWQEREQIKNELSGGSEYFLLLNPVLQETELVNLLKAFSFFKKRLQTSIKLVIAARQEEFAVSLLQLLATYKYKTDVVFAGDLSNNNKRASLAAACYAALQIASPYKTYILPQDALVSAVPVVLCGHPLHSSYENTFIQAGTTPEDIARIMMLLYKDEQYRKQVIENGQQGLHNFSHRVNAALLAECIEYTAGEASSFS